MVRKLSTVGAAIIAVSLVYKIFANLWRLARPA